MPLCISPVYIPLIPGLRCKTVKGHFYIYSLHQSLSFFELIDVRLRNECKRVFGRVHVTEDVFTLNLTSDILWQVLFLCGMASNPRCKSWLIKRLRFSKKIKRGSQNFSLQKFCRVSNEVLSKTWNGSSILSHFKNNILRPVQYMYNFHFIAITNILLIKKRYHITVYQLI